MNEKKKFRFEWLVCVVLAALLVAPRTFAAVAGTASRWVANMLVFDGSSGANAFTFDTDGLRGKFGSCSDCFIAGDSTHLIAGTGSGIAYIASGVPVTLSSVYVNNTISAFTYGGMKLPAHPFTVTNVAYNIRTIGSGGSTNNTFQISDGSNTCTCTFACNQAAASQIATCSNGAGTGCVYAASAALTFGFSAVGDCSTATDILGNMEVLGNWQ